jgi:alpha-L-fucosidase
MLAEICAKGGSLALGVGPTPQGLIQPEVESILQEIGAWLKVNGKAIYNTRITPNYNTGNVWFTADKNEKTLYAIYALPDGEELPEIIEWEGNEPAGRMTLLKGKRAVSYTYKDGKVTVKLPKGLKNEPLAFSFNVKK